LGCVELEAFFVDFLLILHAYSRMSRPINAIFQFDFFINPFLDTSLHHPFTSIESNLQLKRKAMYKVYISMWRLLSCAFGSPERATFWQFN